MNDTFSPSRMPESRSKRTSRSSSAFARRAGTIALTAVTSVAVLGVGVPAASADTVWDRVAECESNQRWSINTGNGYYGGLQFYQPTWVGYGGREYASYAHLASKSEQIAVARRVLAGQGPGAWPVCSVRAGLTRSNGGADPNAQPGGGSSDPGTGATVTRYVSANTSANVRSGPGTGYRIVGSIDRGERVTGRLSGGWLRLSSGRYLGPAVLSSSPVGGGGGQSPSPGTVTRYVSANVSAYVRSGPGTGYRIVGSEPRGERVTGTLVGGWLKLSNGRFIGPAVLSSRPVGGGGGQSPSPGTVTRYVSANVAAYVRSGPGFGYRVVDTERRGTRVQGTWVNGWLKIGNGRYIGSSVLSGSPV
ncbi:MAG: transglycosylase family protein [Ornithinimicrobium sp.]